MPYKSEKIKIAGTRYDRRRKLSEEQREKIRRLHGEGLSQRTLAAMFGVSRRLITFVLAPDKEMKARESFKARKRAGLYKPTKEQWAAVIREHRRYKNRLYKDNKIQ